MLERIIFGRICIFPEPEFELCDEDKFMSLMASILVSFDSLYLELGNCKNKS